MKLKIEFIIFLIVVYSFTSISQSFENKILFKINNEIITSIDLLNEINYLKTISSDFKNTNDNLSYEIAKNSIIREKIKEIELLKLIEKIEIDENLLIQIILSNFKNLNINSLTEFENFFENKNINPSYVKKKISIELLWNQLIYAKYKNKVKIDVDEIKKKLLNDKQIEFLLSEILFELKKDEKLDQKYKLIKKTIDQESFNQAALIHSISESSKNGGEIGWIKQATINKKIFTELEKININDHTNPIVVPGGFLILKIKNKREVEVDIDLERELKKTIEKEKNQQLGQYSNIYFNKIKKNISINDL